jgi:hypothetical protein
MKKTAIVILVILLMIAGSLYFLWRQATLLPEWYTRGEGSFDGTVINYGKGIVDLRTSLERTVEEQLQKVPPSTSKVEIVLDENDANHLFALIISENAATHRYLKAVKASRTCIRDGTLDFALVADASQLLRDASEHADEGSLSVVTLISDVVRAKEISLGFTGRYGLKEGLLQLDEDGKIRIGALTFSSKTVMKGLGISEDALDKKLKGLELGGVKINNMEAIRNVLLLKGSL